MSEEKSPTKRVRELLEGRGIKYEDTDTTKELLRLHDRMNDAMLRYERALGTEHSKSDAVVPFVSEMHAIIEDAATLGRSCASCPEMDNPDSYISHLQSALKWHDEHVPRPTNPHATVVVLRGTRPPDEVLFVRKNGEVTHYLPEGAGTCRMKLMENMHTSAYQDMYECDRCGEQVLRETYIGKSEPPKFCPECGRRNEVDE